MGTHHGIHHGSGLTDDVKVPTTSPWMKIKEEGVGKKKRKKKKKSSDSSSSIFDIAIGASLDDEVKNDVPYWKKDTKKKAKSHWGTVQQSLPQLTQYVDTTPPSPTFAKGREAIKRINAMKAAISPSVYQDDGIRRKPNTSLWG